MGTNSKKFHAFFKNLNAFSVGCELFGGGLGLELQLKKKGFCLFRTGPGAGNA
jgi:hypothetical protein